ncbi:hypothetical protein [Sulfuracidifex tepidarius]|uniref:hypothetical protein n=1 Tax=Sulfuracidifex tepidarius TaxID=1294262 RepID=UPI000ACDE5E8|nr:hypothetical protein [Sulfuracidifex tepidarius]
MSEIIKDLTGKALSKLGYTNVNNLDIKYYQEFKDRYDVFGQFRNERGYFEFAISFDKKSQHQKVTRQYDISFWS